MEQPYWATIHHDLADGIQFVENHVGLMESTKGFPQHSAKKRARFSCVLDTQIRIPIRQPHPPISPPRRSLSPPPPPIADSPSRFSPLPPRLPPPPAQSSSPHSPAVVDDSQFASEEFQLSPPSHRTPAAPRSPLPPPQAIPPIQVILITST